MHRSLHSLQYYTSHTELEVKRLHERIEKSLLSNGSLAKTFYQLTGQKAPHPFRQDDVSRSDWHAFLEGRQHDSLSDFYSLLVSHKLIEEGATDIGTLSALSDEPSTPVSSREKHSLQLPWRWIGLTVSCFLIGLLLAYVYLKFNPSNPTAESTLEDPVHVTEESEMLPLLFIVKRQAMIYEDKQLTRPMYKADFGESFPLKTRKKDIAYLQLPNQTIGYVDAQNTVDALKGNPVADEAVLSWIDQHLDRSLSTDVVGMSKQNLIQEVGPPNRTTKDTLYSYLSYDHHYFTLRKDEVIAIDWTNVDVTATDLASLQPLQLDNENGLLRLSNSYQLHLMKEHGDIVQVRLSNR